MTITDLQWHVGSGPAPAVLAGVLRADGRHAVHWRGACDPDHCAAVVEAARGGALGPSDARDHEDASVPQVRVYGCAISPSDTCPAGPDPGAYFAAAPELRARLARLGEPSFPSLFLEALAFVTGVPASVPRGPRGAYGSCTVRHLTAGTALPPHCEHLYAEIDVYRDLRALGVDLTRQLSFFVVVEAPSRGGELRVHPGPWRPLLERLGPDRREAPDAPPLAAPSIPPSVGDLLIFPSGTTVHEITTVEEGERWTVGGFAAFAPSQAELFAWG